MASVTKRRWTHKGVTKEGWEVRYFDDKGVRRSKTVALKKDADGFKRKVEREMEDGLHIAASQLKTVAEVAADFLAYEGQRLRDGRIGHNHFTRTRMLLEKQIVPFLGSIAMNELKMAHVEELYKRWIDRGLLPRSARDSLHPLRYVEKFAIKRKLSTSHATADVLADLRGFRRNVVRTPTPAEAAKILRVAGTYRTRTTTLVGIQRRTEVMTACMVYMGAFCGLRIGEIMGLRRCDIDFERKVLNIKCSLLTQIDVLKAPKSKAGIRTVPLPDPVAMHLREWLNHHFVENDRDIVFRTKAGRGLFSNVQRLWQDVRSRAGLDDGGKSLHFHALRHFYASWLIHNAVPVTDLAEILGHSHYDVTLKVYAHPLLEAPDRLHVASKMTQLLEAH